MWVYICNAIRQCAAVYKLMLGKKNNNEPSVQN